MRMNNMTTSYKRADEDNEAKLGLRILVTISSYLSFLLKLGIAAELREKLVGRRNRAPCD